MLAGLILSYFILKGRIDAIEHYNSRYYVWVNGASRWGVSLGFFVFLSNVYYSDKDTVKHEYGHTIQSLWWGPLYLIVIGIPSAICNNLWDRLMHKDWLPERRIKWYYTRFPELQADKLGGVERKYS
jgi:hypothetical protein